LAISDRQGGWCRSQHLLHEIGVQLAQPPDALGGLGTEPLAQRRLVGHLFQTDGFQQHRVLSNSLRVGQRRPPAAEREDDLGGQRLRVVPRALALARIKALQVRQAFPQTEAAAEGVHEHLPAVRGCSPCSGQLKLVACLAFAVVRFHAAIYNLCGYCCQAVF
jgi:hypothetical protein